MTIDANLLEGVRLGFGFGSVFGIVIGLLIAHLKAKS